MASLAALAGVAGGASGGFSLGSMLSLGGTILSGVTAVSSGNQQAAALDYQAAQDRVQAQQEKASSEREASEERRQGELLTSRARAVGASSGGGMDYDVLGDIASETEYRSLNALWGGEERARGRRSNAAARTAEANATRKAGRIGGVSTILTGGARWAQNYLPNNNAAIS